MDTYFFLANENITYVTRYNISYSVILIYFKSNMSSKIIITN